MRDGEQVADAGSLNGTMLNGTRISVAGRKRSAAYRLNSDDLLQLGTSTAIKVCPSDPSSIDTYLYGLFASAPLLLEPDMGHRLILDHTILSTHRSSSG